MIRTNYNQYKYLITYPISIIFLKISFLSNIQEIMENVLPEFEPYKDKIPEFVIKLYHILEKIQYSDYLCWNGNNQILIKSIKKLQDKVLPHFFRHKHISSFIRQLNMYKFGKVTKLTKEKNYMYFKNEHFRRGQIRELLKIKRNNKKSKKENLSLETISDGENEDMISIDNELEKNMALNDYRQFVKSRVKEIAAILKKIEDSCPSAKDQIVQSLNRCNELLEVQSQGDHNSMMNLQDSKNNTQNMLISLKFLPALQPQLFPSQCNF